MSQDELTNAVRADIACIEREVSRLIEQAGNGITVIQRHTCEPPPLAAVRGWPQRVRPHTLCQRARVVVAANIQGARLVQRYMHARHATLTESFLHDSSPGTTTGNLRQAAGHAEYQLKQLRDLAVSAPPPPMAPATHPRYSHSNKIVPRSAFSVVGAVCNLWCGWPNGCGVRRAASSTVRRKRGTTKSCASSTQALSRGSVTSSRCVDGRACHC